MISKALVLGDRGFLGRAIVEYCEKVLAISVLGGSSLGIDLLEPGTSEALARVLDAGTLLVLSVRPRDRADTLGTFEQSLCMIANVARALNVAPVQKCVFISTAAVYGTHVDDFAVTEETAVDPATFYGTAKYASERILRKAAEAAGFPLLILRPCRVYGPADPGYGPTAFVTSALRERVVTLYGDGRELRDFLFVEDAARLTCQLAAGEHAGLYNLASGERHTFREIVDILHDMLPCDFDVASRPRTLPVVDQAFDIAKLSGALAGVAFTPLSQGLRHTVRAAAEAHRAGFGASRA